MVDFGEGDEKLAKAFYENYKEQCRLHFKEDIEALSREDELEELQLKKDIEVYANIQGVGSSYFKADDKIVSNSDSILDLTSSEEDGFK